MLAGKNNEEKIWNYLKGAGLNDFGTAGLMGNLYAESGLIPNNVENLYEKRRKLYGGGGQRQVSVLRNG